MHTTPNRLIGLALGVAIAFAIYGILLYVFR